MTWGSRGRWDDIGCVGQDEVSDQQEHTVEDGVNFIDTASV